MSYATRDDMVARFGLTEMVTLTDRNFFGEVDDRVLNYALDEASVEIDPYLQPKYRLPLATVPKIIVGFACDIARYRLCGAGVTITRVVSARPDEIAVDVTVAAGAPIGPRDV